MKRILIAAIMAVGIHGLLLCMEFDWISGRSSGRSKPRIMTMTLVTRQPVKAELKPVANKRTSKKRAAKPTRQKKIERPPEATNNNKKESESDEQAVGILVEENFDETNRSFMDAQGFIPVREAIPIYDKNPSPVYPAIAKRKGFQGTVVLEALIEKSGRVGDLKIFKSSGYKVLDRAAVESVKEWTFKPAIRENEEVEMWVRVPVCFQLK